MDINSATYNQTHAMFEFQTLFSRCKGKTQLGEDAACLCKIFHVKQFKVGAGVFEDKNAVELLRSEIIFSVMKSLLKEPGRVFSLGLRASQTSHSRNKFRGYFPLQIPILHPGTKLESLSLDATPTDNNEQNYTMHF